VRAALCSEPLSARMTRLHNDANCLCMGARMIGEEMAAEILTVFMNTGFEGGRHQRRLDKIE
jgi:ribose 5-phosphate isomerase B